MHHRTFFDLGPSRAGRARHGPGHLLDHHLNVATAALVLEDPDVFEAHQGQEDLSRVEKDECAPWFLAPTSSSKCVRPILGDLWWAGSQRKSKAAVAQGIGW